MRVLRFLVFLPLVIVSGCISSHENSATAGKGEIETQLAAQLHCQTLHLKKNGPDSFFGAGRNDNGAFTIDVTRQGDTITFHGAYLAPAKATFSGTATWHTISTAGIGFHADSESSHASLGTP